MSAIASAEAYAIVRTAKLDEESLGIVGDSLPVLRTKATMVRSDA